MMKKTLLLLSFMFGILSTVDSQVTSVDFQIKYNDTICEYDAFIIINAGSATTIPQRIQFHTQYSIIVPTGTDLTVTESHMPLRSNATYTGTDPLIWSKGTPILSPGAQPQSDFYSITPDLGVTSHYNNLTAGDTIKIFSFAVDTLFECSQGLRIFENGVDPDSDAQGMGMADFSNGFTLGSINQIYSANSTQVYPSQPEIISITNACSNGVEIDLTAETSDCQGPMTYAWTGPDGYTATTEDINITPALPVNNGTYKVVITDAFGCKDSITLDATSKPNAGSDMIACAGSTTTIYGTSPTTGTWAQSGANSFGASLSPLAGGATEVTFSTFAAGTFNMIYSIPGCSDTMTFMVNPAPMVNIEVDQICENEQTVASSNIPGGTWVSNSPLIATIDFNTGIITGQTQGVVTITYTAPTGCSSVTNSLTVNPGATVTITGSDSICVGEVTFVTPTTGGTWVSSDNDVATVSNTGIVTGVGPGSVTLGFTDSFTGCTSDGLDIVVNNVPAVSITGPSTICVGETTQLLPSSGGTWSCSDPSIITIENNGLITAISAGGTVTCTWTDNLTGCTSDASDPIIVISNQGTTVIDDELCIGETTQVLPSSGGTWVSADPLIVTVTASGLAQGTGPGVTTLIFTSAATGCNSEPSDPITVHGFVSTVITGETEICIGGTSQMSPSSGGTWTSSDPSVLTINNTGLVTGIAAGKATFTFTPDATGCPSLPSDPIEVNSCVGPELACDQIQLEDLICNFDLINGYTGTMNVEDSGGTQPLPLCSGLGEADNILWFGFIALEGDYQIVISFENCEAGDLDAGIQAGVYTDCTFEDYVYCKPDENTLDIIVPSSSLQPGQDYYLYIDGFANTVCDYRIDIEGFYDNTYCTELSKVTGVAYIDDNENGVYEVGETLLRNALISLSPGNFSVLTNDEGRYIINTPKGGATLTAKMNEGNWLNDELTIEDISVFESCVEGIDFGFVPGLINQEVKISVANTVTRCDWETKFYFTIENTGATDLNANFEFDFDAKTSYFATNLIGLQVNGEIASGDLGTMNPFEVREFWITLKMPSGSTVQPILDFKTTLFNDAGIEMDRYEQSEQLLCSYDPNDKREYPNREGVENLTLMDEELEYTIRFQNNGNDTAFLVKIVDPLDPNIEPTSIRVINSSHSVETCIENENLIFIFEDINLVDSMTNYDGSQGFVSFRCNSKEDRVENTIVNNTADIIFDTNVPIVTNTTINTLVSELCTNVSTEIDIEICEGDTYNGYDESGTYTEFFPLTFGCDSMVIINLEVLGITYSSQEIEICEGEAFVVNGNEYILYESQEITDTVKNAIGCISAISIFDVQVNPIENISIDTTICEGLEYEGLTESGTYTFDSFDAVTGCDILTTVNLEVLPMNDPSCIVGTNDEILNDVKIYPNPASNQFFVEGSNAIGAISIYTMAYQKVEDVKIDSDSYKVQMSTENLSQGLYILVIKSGNRFIYKKLIVE